MEPMMNILLLAVLFVAGFVNFLIYFFPTKRFSACFQSLKPSPKISLSKPATVPPPPASERKAELKKVFGTFDKNNDGYITKKELMESLRNIRILITETEAEEMFKGVDENGDGLIDFEEFCVLGQKLIGGEGRKKEDEDEDEDENEEELRDAFGVFDKDKDGLISVEELSLILSSLGLKEGRKVENCKEMIRKVDLDGDGMVNFDEFKTMMRSGGSLILSKS